MSRRAEVLAALAATRWDVEAFAELLGMKGHPGQQRFWRAGLMRDQSGFHPDALTLALAAGNRAGKTTGLAIYIFHHAFHKIGMPNPDPSDLDALEEWAKAPYHAYHFGLVQEVSELVYTEIEMIINGVHPGQAGRGCPLVEALGRDMFEIERKERGDYRWVQIDPSLGGAEIHFRTTNEKALGSLGKNVNLVTYDECGFDNNLEFVVNEVLHLRRLSTGGQMILISTPSEAFQMFEDEWNKGDPENPRRESGHMSLRMSTRDNIGFGIDQGFFDRMVSSMPSHLVKQNIDGFFISSRGAFFDKRAVDLAFVDELPESSQPAKGHSYIQGVDPALTFDATWCIILDHTESDAVFGAHADRREGKQHLTDLTTMITVNHRVYSVESGRCMTAVDTSGMGGKVFKDELRTIHPLRTVEFGGTKNRKIKMLVDLKGMLEKGMLRFPRRGVWLELRRQLLAYRIDDRQLKTDAVMALAVAVKQIVGFGETKSWNESLEFDFMAEEEVDERAKAFPENRWVYDDRIPGVGPGRRVMRVELGSKWR